MATDATARGGRDLSGGPGPNPYVGPQPVPADRRLYGRGRAVEPGDADRHELLALTNRMRALDGVASTETFLYMQMVKQLYDWGTRVHEDDE